MTTIAERLKLLNTRIVDVAANLGRDPTGIRLLAVSKTKPLEDVYAAIDAGQTAFGENYLQDAVKKIAACERIAEWHFIGAIQSNKTRLIAANFTWAHSVDRLKIAQRLNAHRADHFPDSPLNICLQINISGEQNKSGVAPDQAEQLAAQIKTLPHIRLRGLMTVAQAAIDDQTLEQQFASMEALYLALNKKGYSLDTLSMGMSQDWPIALKYGANMIRIGTDIFGARDAPT